VQHVLRFKLLHQAVGDELVVFGCLEIFGHGFEGHEEGIEVLVAVQLFYLSDGAGFSVALSEFDQRCWIDRTFQMQMQLSLGKGNEE